MRKIKYYCHFCDKDTEQNAVVESYLSSGGYDIIIHFWTRCIECDNNVVDRTKEICFENL